MQPHQQHTHAETKYTLDPIKIPFPLNTSPQVLPVYGTIETTQGASTRGAIVIVTINEEASWSSFVKDKKSWVVPLSLIRTKDAKEYYCNTYDCNKNPNLTISVYAEEGSVTYTTTGERARPVEKTLVIGSKNISSQNNLSPISSPSMTPRVQGAHTTPTLTSPPSPIKKVQKKQAVSILYPKKNTRTPYSKPLIRGEGIPGNSVTIILESKIRQVDTVIVQKDGTWLWTPKVALSPGAHTVSITTKDSNKLAKSFLTFIMLPRCI